jgi:thiamine biosynthesis protein ThiC
MFDDIGAGFINRKLAAKNAALRQVRVLSRAADKRASLRQRCQLCWDRQFELIHSRASL